MSEAARKSGSWLVCRPGCWQCCVGIFPIDRPDAERLRAGLRRLRDGDAIKAERIMDRVRESAVRLRAGFPGDAGTGILDESDDGLDRFDEFANDEVCPVLDPLTGTCDLYDSRPMACRTFGPAVRVGAHAVGVCELCFEGATADEIAACGVALPEGIDAGAPHTIVAFGLMGAPQL